MAGVWTDPRTWVDGETPTGSQFNTQIRDNLRYLKDAPSFDGNLTIGGNLNVQNIAVIGDLSVGDDAMVSGDLEVLGMLSVRGNTTLGDAPADVVDVKGTVINAPLKTYTETRTDPVIAGGALTLDCALGTYFKVALNAPCTVAITNPPAAGRALGLVAMFVADGTLRVVTWPASVKWPSGTAPTMTATAGKRDVVTLITEDAGVTWIGIVVGQNY